MLSHGSSKTLFCLVPFFFFRIPNKDTKCIITQNFPGRKTYFHKSFTKPKPKPPVNIFTRTGHLLSGCGLPVKIIPYINHIYIICR